MTPQTGTAFGVTAGGEPVEKLTLHAGGLTVCLLTWGAVLQSVRLDGVAHDLTLGSERLADYEGPMRHHGSVVAPVANRITGASGTIAGKVHHFHANQDGRITLHSGKAGTHLKVWTLTRATTDSATLTCDLPDGEGGFPGNRKITATFTVLPPATLRLVLSATTDATTWMNAVNHSYWNLDGTADWTGHHLQIAADSYLPTNPDFTPTGEIAPVAGTAMDFRTPRRIAPHEAILDTNFCLASARRALTPVLTLTGTSGTSLSISTTEPGIQVYDGRDAIRPGHGRHEGLAIEAQFWPDAPNHPAFPDITLHPDQKWEQITEWHFSAP